jgi:hypothetical protein
MPSQPTRRATSGLSRLLEIGRDLAVRRQRSTVPSSMPSKLMTVTVLQCRCPREEPIVDSADPTGHALELARSATLATARPRTPLAAVARPAAEVAGLLLVEVLGSSRVRAAALGLARSLAAWLAGRRPPASAGVEVTTRQVTVVQHGDTRVLVHRVETALVVRTSKWPAVGPPAMSIARTARDNSGK